MTEKRTPLRTRFGASIDKTLDIVLARVAAKDWKGALAIAAMMLGLFIAFAALFLGMDMIDKWAP